MAGKSGVRVCVRSTVRLNVILGRDVGADCADAAFEIPPSPAAAAQLPAAIFKKRRRPATIRSTSAMMNGEHMMGSPFTRRGGGRTIHRPAERRYMNGPAERRYTNGPAERRYTNAKARKKVVSRTESLLLTASGQFARPRTAQTATADPATEPQSDLPRAGHDTSSDPSHAIHPNRLIGSSTSAVKRPKSPLGIPRRT